MLIPCADYDADIIKLPAGAIGFGRGVGQQQVIANIDNGTSAKVL